MGANLSRKPLLGFGWIGGAAAVIAALLLASLLSGFDLRHEIMRVITDAFGWRAMFWFTSVWLTWQHFATLQPTFGLIGLCYLLIAMRVHPAPMRWWRYALAVAWAVIGPVSFVYIYRTLSVTWPGFWPAAIPQRSYAFATFAAEIGTIALLLVVTRSRLVVWTAVAATPAAWLLWSEIGLGQWLVGPLWHTVLCGTLLWWSIRGRVTVVPPYLCASCRYDLRGLNPSVCPECGAPAAPSRQPTTATDAATTVAAGP